MKKRVISLGLALMMLCSTMGVTAFAAPIEKKNELLAVNAFVMEQVEAFAAIDDSEYSYGQYVYYGLNA